MSITKKKISIIFLGSRPISLKFYSIFKSQIIGVIKTKENQKWWKKDINNKKKIKFLKLNQLKNLEYDLGISLNYNKKIDEKILSTAKIGFLNIHYSYKNYYRGRNIMFLSIINYPKQMAGFTVHWINQKFDSGKILFSKKVIINKNDTSEKLYFKIEKKLYFFLKNILRKNLNKFLNLKTINPIEKPIYFKKKQLNEYINNYLKKNGDKKKLIRALTFKNYNKKLISKLKRI